VNVSRAPLLKRLHNGHVLGTAACLTLPASVFSAPFIAPLLSIAAAVALVVMRVRERRWPAPPAGIAILFAALVLYGAVSSLWAVQPRLSLILAAQLLGLFAAGLVLVDAARRLAPEERAVFESAFLAGFLCGLVLLLSETVTGAAIDVYLRNLASVKAIIGEQRPIYLNSHFNRSDTLVGLLVWPAAAIVRRRGGNWIRVAVLVLLAYLTVHLGRSETAKYAFLASGFVCLLAYRLPRRAAAVLGVLVALGILVAPLVLRSGVLGWSTHVVADPGKAPSLIHRFEIWDFATGKIAERPIFGWGLNSSRVMPGGHIKTVLGGEQMPLHPHDMALQIWLELGVPGVLIGIALVLLVSAAAGRLRARPLDQAAALAVIAAATVNGITGYDLWHPWWLSFVWMAAASAVGSLRPPERRSIS
jgi:exopolysaccharide production protein ExoQ